jgi:hypothetical protein
MSTLKKILIKTRRQIFSEIAGNNPSILMTRFEQSPNLYANALFSSSECPRVACARLKRGFHV